MNAVDLIDEINAYGAIELRPGRMLVPADVPKRLQRALAQKFYDVVAVLREWDCSCSSEAVAAAEEITRKAVRRNSRSRKARA
jgi:hypothetical protein